MILGTQSGADFSFSEFKKQTPWLQPWGTKPPTTVFIKEPKAFVCSTFTNDVLPMALAEILRQLFGNGG